MWCIYRITNLINGKTYIGLHGYSCLDDDYMGSGTYLKKAQEKYGIENFKKEILVSRIPSRECANAAEINHIRIERKHGKSEYNITDGGEGFHGHHTQEYVEKLRQRMIGNKFTLGKNLGNKFASGYKHTEDAKKRIGMAAVGNQYAKGKNIGNNFAKGNILSWDTKRRMSDSRKGNTNNGISVIQCVETGEVKRAREWILCGYQNAYRVANGMAKTCKGLHFVKI